MFYTQRTTGSRIPGRAALWSAFLLLLTAGVLPAQRGEARIPVQVLGGKLVARCQLSSPTNSAPVNLWLAFDRPCGLELHNKVAAGLEVEQPDGTTLPITMEFPGLDLEVPMREHGDEEEMEAFTQRYAPQMQEVACAGTIGAKVLADYEVTFDLARNQVRLRPAVDREGARPEGPEAHYVSASVAGDVVWVAGLLDSGHRRMVGIGSSRIDSVVDEAYCFEVDAPDGRIGSVTVADVDLSEIVAWRPEIYDLVHRDGALATLGIGFLQQFRVHVDATNGWVGFTRVVERPYPVADAAFFAARAEEETDALAAWLEDYGHTRLGGECAQMLVQMQVDEGAPAVDVENALRWVHKTRLADMQCTEALKQVDMLVQARRPDLAVMAGRMGIEGGRNDRYPESVHRLHVRLGELLLEADDNRGAWEHLMAAAFGLTDAVGSADRAKVNLLLGRVYERQGKFRRAMSRYVQAVISPEFGPQAVPRMEGLQAKMGGERFSVDLVERMISGKVRSMTAPTRFEAEGVTDNNHCVLVEHFTNPHLGQKQGERWRAFTEGGAMVFEALQSHFPPERVAMLSYHLDAPRPVALMNELSLAEGAAVGGRPVFTVDGVRAGPGAFRFPDADPVYEQVRDRVVQRLSRKSSYDIELTATLEGGVLKGRAVVRGPQRMQCVVQLVLAEKGAIYPGLGATVIHKMIARAALTQDVGGAAYQSEDGAMELTFERQLVGIERENLAFLDRYEADGGSPASRLSTRMDPDQLVVVAIVRNPINRLVDQAAQVDVTVVPEDQ